MGPGSTLCSHRWSFGLIMCWKSSPRYLYFFHGVALFRKVYFESNVVMLLYLIITTVWTQREWICYSEQYKYKQHIGHFFLLHLGIYSLLWCFANKYRVREDLRLLLREDISCQPYPLLEESLSSFSRQHQQHFNPGDKSCRQLCGVERELCDF